MAEVEDVGSGRSVKVILHGCLNLATSDAIYLMAVLIGVTLECGGVMKRMKMCGSR